MSRMDATRISVLGIDPGKTGGWAIVVGGGAVTTMVAGARMPTKQIVGGKTIIDAPALHEAISTRLQAIPGGCGIDIVEIEQVGAMPKQGVTSAFTFGRATGAGEAIATLFSETVNWTTPAVWKKKLGLSSNKRASLEMASTRIRGFSSTVLADDGIAEAALLALYRLERIADTGRG